jgi:hypothetical protein
MYDINFFSVYKRKKSKGGKFKTFIIIFLALYIVLNALLVGYGLMTFKSLEKNIADKESWLNSDDTKKKIADAAQIKKEASLSSEYLALLQRSTIKLDQLNVINTDLFNEIRKMTPPTTFYISAEYKGISINLDCASTTVTDPIDMFHAFLSNPIFATVKLNNINVMADGTVQFSLDCQLAGGDKK